MSETNIRGRVKHSITAKDILCLPSKLLTAWIDTINPRNICRNYARCFWENKATWVLAFALLAFFSIRFAFMDFDLSVFGISNTMFAGGTITDIKNNLTISTHLHTDNVDKLFDLFKPVGISLSVLYWMIMLVGMSVRDQFTVEQVAMHMIRLIFPVFLIEEKGYDILKKMLEIGESLMADVIATITDPGVTGNEAGDLKVGLFAIVSALIPLFVLWLIGMACKLIMLLTCFQRRIKAELLIAFAPVALADITGDSHSTSIRYCKTILAIGIQGAMIVGMALIAITLLKDAIGGLGYGDDSLAKLVADGAITPKDTLPVLAVGLTVIGLYPKTEEIAKTLVGV